MVTSNGRFYPECPQCSDTGIAWAPETTAAHPLVWPTQGSTSCLQAVRVSDPNARPRLPQPAHVASARHGWFLSAAATAWRTDLVQPAACAPAGQPSVSFETQISLQLQPSSLPSVPRCRQPKQRQKKRKGGKSPPPAPNLLPFVFHKTNYRLEIAVINLISHLGASPAAESVTVAGARGCRCVRLELLKLPADIIPAPLQPGGDWLPGKRSSCGPRGWAATGKVRKEALMNRLDTEGWTGPGLSRWVGAHPSAGLSHGAVVGGTGTWKERMQVAGAV